MSDSYLIEILLEAKDNASQKIRDLQHAVDELKAKAAGEDATKDLRSGLSDTADEAERATQAHKDLARQQQETRRAAQQSESDVKRTARWQQEASEAATGHAESLQEVRRQQQLLPQDAQRAEASVKRVAQQHDQAAESVTSHAQAHVDLGASTEEARQKVDQLAAGVRDLDGDLGRASAGTDKLSEAQQKAATRGEALLGSLERTDQAARSHTATNKQLEVSYKQVESGLRSVMRQFDAGSSEAHRFGNAMEDAGKKAKNTDLARASSSVGEFAQKFAAATDSVGVHIMSLSAGLRGLRLTALLGLFQPLITGLGSLVAGFFNVASGASQAGASIGGVFLSGLGQMIPMVSVGIAALIRLRDVFQAVQAAQQARQTAFFQPSQGLINQLQNTSQLIESEQNLANSYYTLKDAQVQVRESQIALTQARIDAVRNLQDLTLAEKSAQLQLKEANLSVLQAEQQLRAVQASGSQVGIQQAQLQLQGAQVSRQQAHLAVPRSRQDLQLALSYGVTGSPQVLAASESYRQSLLAVVQAQQQVANAQRQMRITELQLAQPASHMTSQQGTLQYLLGQMSAPEKALFSMLNNLETQLRSPSSPLKKITDYIVTPFLDAGMRLQQLLGNKSFMQPINALAKAMGQEFGGLEKTMFGQRGTSFFETMSKDATKSIPIITKAITGLMKVFEDIATAAAPAFRQLSGDWARFWDAMDARDRTPQGQARLTSFFNQGAKWAEDFAHLAGATFDLFKALGHDAAPQGMKTVTSFTEALHDATTWVQNHGPEVTRFFSDARQGLGLIGGVLFNVGSSLIQVFNLTSLRAFAGLLNNIVLPAARILATTVGFLVTQFMRLLDAVAPLKAVVVGLVAAFLGLMVLNRVISLVTTATNVVHGFFDAFKAFQEGEGILNRIGAAWEALTTRISKGAKATRDVAAAQTELAGATDASSARQVADEQAVDAAIIEQTTLITTEEADLAILAAGGTAAGGGVAAGAGGAGVPAAEVGAGGAAAGVGAARFGLTRVLPIAAAAYLADKTNAFGQNITAGKSTKGDLASMLGPVGGSHESGISLSSFANFATLGLLGSSTSSNQGSRTTADLSRLQQGLKGVTDASQLSNSQLQSMYGLVQKLSQQPDLTLKQREAIRALSNELNPLNVALKKSGAQWATTFTGFDATTKNVMGQIQQQLSQDNQAISSNFIQGTQGWTEQVTGLTAAAFTKIQTLAALGVSGVGKAMGQLDRMLDNALKALGQGGISLGTGARQINPVTQSNVIAGLLGGTLSAGGVMSQAEGGWNAAQPGGRLVHVAEGGHDEVTLTTDPRHAPRQRALLSRYLQNSPHLAKGGLVGNASIYTSPFGNANVSWGRTDQGVDVDLAPGTPIGVIGNAHVEGVKPGWYNGQPLIWYQLTGGPDAGQYVYVAEQITGVPGIPSNDPRATSSLQAEVGRTLSEGQRIAYYATSGSGIETGWATASGETMAMATTGYQEGQVTPAGSSFRTFLSGLQRGVITGGLAAIQKLVAPKVKGVGGAWGAIAQGVVNKVTNAANQYLARFVGSAGMPNVKLSGSVEKQVDQFMSAAGFNKIAIAGMLGNAYQESSMDPNAAGGGLWQQISNFGSGSGGSLLHQMQTMLPQIESLKAAMNAAKSPGDAATIFEQGFERAGIPAMSNRITGANAAYAQGYAAGGLLTRHARRIGLRHLRKHVLRFAGGGRAPWGGEPVPIMAHEGERVVNPPQWDELGRITGMGAHGLDSHLGYDSEAPRQHFDVGGQVPKHFKTVSSATSFLQSVSANLFKIDPGSLTSGLEVLSGVFQAVVRAFTKIDALPIKKQTDKIGTLLEAFADPNNPNSTLNMLSAAFQRFQNNLTNWITGIGYRSASVRPTSVARVTHRTPAGFAGSGYGGVSLRGAGLLTTRHVAGVGTVTSGTGHIGETGQAELDALGVRASVEETDYLRREAEATTKAINEVKSRISKVRRSRLSKSTKDSTVKKLESAYTLLVQQQEGLNNSINSQITTTFQAEQQYVQDTLNQVSDVYQTQQTQIQAAQSTAQSKGQYGALQSIDKALAESAKHQISALQKPLQEAKKMHDADLVAQIEQEIAQLNQTVGQATIQMVQDKFSAVEQTFQTKSAQQSAIQSAAQSLGQLSLLPGIDAAIIQTTQQHITSLQAVLAQAVAGGDQGLASQIEQEIAQLQGSVVQMTAQMIQDSISAVQQTAQTQQAKVSELQSISQTMTQSASTPGQFAAAGATNLQALQLNQSSLQGQLQSYNSLLVQASAAGDTGAVATLTQTIDGLTAQLAQNDLALQDNTAQVVNQTAQYIQSRGQFQTGVFGGLGQIIQTIGQTTGFTDVASLKALTSMSNTSLQGTNTGLLGQLGQLGDGASGLASLLGQASTPQQFVTALSGANISGIESGHDAAWISTFEGLISSLESNTGAIAQNNQQLATLNGQLLQPQQWSTSAWSSFRTAIFSGMGNLLPQFQASLPAGSAPSIAPTFTGVTGGTTPPTIGELNINHAPTTSLDPSIIGEQLAHEVSGAL